MASGRADVAMALCFDKFTEMGGTGGRGGGRDVIDAPILPASYFALWAQRRMHDRGTTVETYAKIAAKNWNYGAVSPMSHRQPDHEVTPEEVLASRMVARPLTSMMCCPADDGAACVILARERPRPGASARSTGGEAVGVGTAVGVVRAWTHVRRPRGRTVDDDAGHGAGVLEAASLGPDDVDVAFIHDAFVNEELEYYELLGFAEPGGGDKLVAEGQTGPGGRIPFNTDGGLLARGHPGGPTGLAIVHECVQQLRGDATGRQVEGARVALAHLVGGGSVCTVNLLGVTD